MTFRLLTLTIEVLPERYVARVDCLAAPLAGNSFCADGSTPIGAVRAVFRLIEKHAVAELDWMRCLELLADTAPPGGGAP